MWYRDKFVWTGAFIGTLATAYALFIGEYLPYIDWSNHLALISVLAHGQESGALDYMSRSWAPTPYLLFYGLSALLAQTMSVTNAAKLLLVLSSAGYTLGAAAWAQSMGRSPRQGLIAPLAFFGISMGYGFASFVFATPLLFFTLAAAEPLFQKEPSKRKLVQLGAWLCLAYLAHALIFLALALLLILRTATDFAIRRKIRPLFMMSTAAFPSVLLALPATITHIRQPWQEAGTKELTQNQLVHYSSWAEHKSGFWGHLLERGSSDHLIVMKFAAGLFFVWLVWGLFQRHHTAQKNGDLSAWLYASALSLMFLGGPNAIEWPSSLWMTYPRFGVIAAVALFLIPKPKLNQGWGAAFALCASVLVISNARINAHHVERFSNWAHRYDAVRNAIPARARVLALTVTQAPDLTSRHPALGSLYFYHMVDGASYVAFLFDNSGLPIRQKEKLKPRAPFWKTPYAFNPQKHGVDFDYIVLRGKGLVDLTSQSKLHTKVSDINGWSVFKTKNPSPRP